MATLTATDTTPATTGGDTDKLDHFHCRCDPHRSLCGLDIAGLDDVAVVGSDACALCILARESHRCPGRRR